MKQEIVFQKVEGFSILVFAVYTFSQFGLNWWWFIGLLFLIDLFMIGYAFDKKIGALVYNIGHSLTVPVLLWLASWQLESSVFMTLSLVWFAHIGMDRAFGYGLKLYKGFNYTHLGEVGKK